MDKLLICYKVKEGDLFDSYITDNNKLEVRYKQGLKMKEETIRLLDGISEQLEFLLPDHEEDVMKILHEALQAKIDAANQMALKK